MATYSDIPWNIQNAYGIEFGDWLEFTSGSGRFVANGEESLKVLKLHGSLNWIYKVRSNQDPRNALRQPSGKLLGFNCRNVIANLRYKPDKRTVDMIPLIVPPIYEKASRYQAAVGEVWIKAASVAAETDRLVIFGYSFPDTDFTAKSLFKRAFFKNKRTDEIVVIDTNPDVAAKVAQLLKPKALYYFGRMADFRKFYCGRIDA